MKKSLTLCLYSIVLIVCLFVKVSASTVSIETLAAEYTENDMYYCEGVAYHIDDYATSGSTVDVADRGIGYGQRFIINENSYKYDNNDIVKIIPEELFFREGTYSYSGKEYGFYISTELVNNGMNYRSRTIVYNYDFIIPDAFSNETVFTIKIITNAVYEGYTRDRMGVLSSIIADGKDRVVAYLCLPNDSEGITISDLSIYTEISNHNDLNPGDTNYRLIDDSTRELVDVGDYIYSFNLEVCPKFVPAEQVDTFSNAEKFIYMACKKIIKETSVLSPLLALENLDKNLIKLIDGSEQGTYSSYTIELNFPDLDSQVISDGKYVRCVESRTNNSDGFNPRFADGDYCVATTTFSGSFSFSNRRTMNLNYLNSFNINDPNLDTSLKIEISRDYIYNRGGIVCQEDVEYDLQIDNDLRRATAYFYSDNTNETQFYVSNESIKTLIYDETKNLISSGYGTVTINSSIIGAYYIVFEGSNGLEFKFAPKKTFTHEHTYIWVSNTKHKNICTCGEETLEGHVVSADAFNDGSQTSICLLCGGIASIGFTQNCNKIKISENGSFILNNGLIVLKNADIESYLSGTLIFYENNNDLAM